MGRVGVQFDTDFLNSKFAVVFTGEGAFCVIADNWEMAKEIVKSETLLDLPFYDEDMWTFDEGNKQFSYHDDLGEMSHLSIYRVHSMSWEQMKAIDNGG